MKDIIEILQELVKAQKVEKFWSSQGLKLMDDGWYYKNRYRMSFQDAEWQYRFVRSGEGLPF